MSSRRRNKKGEKPAKAVFVESSAQMTKSRNMAEEKMLRHRLKGLEDQRRRSILAFKEEEKVLIRDLETQRRGSLELTPSNSRRGSCRSIEDIDNFLKSRDNKNETNKNKTTAITNPIAKNKNKSEDIEGKKHLWKNPNGSIRSSRGSIDDTKAKTPNKDRTRSDFSKSSKRIHSEDSKTHISDIVNDILPETHESSSCDNVISKGNCIVDSNKNSTITTNLLLRQPSICAPPSSKPFLSRSKSKQSIEEFCYNDEQFTLNPENTTSTPRKDKPRTKSEERRDRSNKMSLAKRSGSLQWTSFIEDMDNELNSAYGLIDTHTRKLSRSVNLIKGDGGDEEKVLLSKSLKPINDNCGLGSSMLTNSKELNKNFKNDIFSSNNTLSPLADRTSKHIVSQYASNRSPRELENTPIQTYSDRNTIESIHNRTQRTKPHTIEGPNKLCELNNNCSPSSPHNEPTSTRETSKRNSVGRNKIVLSPIASRTTKPPSNSYVPTCAEKKPTKKHPNKKRSEPPEPIKTTTVNFATSDSDSGGSNVSRRGSIPENYPRSSLPTMLDLPTRPMSSWSQRKRSIVFGEKTPSTPREVLNDTHAQWEELGDFFGEIRRQHNRDQARLPSAARFHNVKTSNSLSPSHEDQSPRRSISNSFANLVDDRLLPRRHSESNIILLSHASRGKKDVVSLRPAVGAGGGGGGGGGARRKSCIPPDHPCSVSGHSKNTTTSVKKLVAIHNVLQTSALSMADMESEMF